MKNTNKALASDVLRLLTTNGKTLVVAESCTAGLLCTFLSEAEGAGDHFHGGFVTYTKEQKHRSLGISRELLLERGAVCPEVARAMAIGALEASSADFSAAITGVAGPASDDDGNPVGRVCIAVATRAGGVAAIENHYGDLGRDEIRSRAVFDTLTAILGEVEPNLPV